MIDELREAFELAARKSEREQAAIAERIKEMIEADAQWEALLADPDSLADARRDGGGSASGIPARRNRRNKASMKSRRTKRFREAIRRFARAHSAGRRRRICTACRRPESSWPELRAHSGVQVTVVFGACQRTV